MIGAETEDAFVARFGDIYEHSPWIVRAAWPDAPFVSVGAMIEATARIVRAAGPERQYALVRAHPELARRFGVDLSLGALSAAEQEGAGLDRLSQAEFEEFRSLNDAYRARFDMPFVICVRRATKTLIRGEIRRRLAQAPAQELSEALSQIDEIARLRLADKVTI